MVNRIYLSERQLNKVNAPDTEVPFLLYTFLFLMALFHPKFMTSYFDFDIVNLPFLDFDFSCRPSYWVYISQVIRFARVCSHVTDFKSRNKC